MKLETLAIIIKGACLTYIPLGTAIVVGLPETELTTLVGLPVKFWSLMMSATVAGAGGLLAFMSGSFSWYQQQKKADDTGKAQVIEPTVLLKEKEKTTPLLPPSTIFNLPSSFPEAR